ncbi:S-Ena type endospore appendage [Bacillus sp. 7894-2]|uniref:DUF3992 domain-containing protein n=1 Tax=Bacillus sp. 7894-2 TaxID=2021695 RepID=UPI001155181C|nr:S-Ena type endospore appendage [Bacillus sp. 7894-2]
MEFCTSCNYREDLCRCEDHVNEIPRSHDQHSQRDQARPDHNHYPKPPTPSFPKKELIHDEVCGNIEQICGDDAEIYWTARGIRNMPAATISVVNKGSCDISVLASPSLRGDLEELFTVSAGQTKSTTIGALARIGFVCSGNEVFTCRGTYCLSLHYEIVC